MEALDFMFRILDQATGPAAKIGNSVGKLSDQFDKLQANLGAGGVNANKVLDGLGEASKLSPRVQRLGGIVERTLGSGAAKQFTGAAVALGKVDDALGSVGTSLGGLASGAALGTVAIVGAAATAAAGLTVAGSKLALSAVDFRENAVIGFEAFLGSTEAASALYEKALDLADKVGLDKGEAISQLKGLLSSGVGEGQALAILEALGNVAQVKGASGAGAIANLVEKIQASGKFDAKSFKALEKQGIATVEIYAALEKATGKTRKEVEALVKAGKITSGQGIAAIAEAINGGKLGKLGERAGSTTSRLFGDVAGNFERLFDKVDVSPVKAMLESTIAALQGPAGEKLRSAINHFFGTVFKTLEKVFGGATAEQTITNVAAGIEGATVAAERLGAALVAIDAKLTKLADATYLFREFSVGAEKFTAAGLVVQAVIDTIGWSITALGYIVDGATRLISISFQIMGESLKRALDPAAALEAGFQFVAGLASGITGGASAAVNAAIELGRSVLAGLDGALKIASPSKEAAERGAYLSEGFGQGVQGDSSAQDATTDMVSLPSSNEARSAGRAAGESSSAGGGDRIYNIVIQASGGDPEAIRQAVIDALEEADNG